MRASLRNKVAGSLMALAIGVGLASVVTPASAWWYHGYGGHGGYGWHGGYAGWHGWHGWYGGYGWRGGYAGWRGGYLGAAPVVGVGFVPGPACAPGFHLGPYGQHCWPN
jgi:hypothetical protein